MTAESEGHESIISFFSHGRAFAIHDHQRFVKEIMPRYFLNMGKIASFQRQLNLYGFKRITDGPDTGGYWHRKFVRGRRDLVVKLKRKSTSEAKRLIQEKKEAEEEANDDINPSNFYDMPVSRAPSSTVSAYAVHTVGTARPSNLSASEQRNSSRTDLLLQAQSLLELRDGTTIPNTNSNERVRTETNAELPVTRIVRYEIPQANISQMTPMIITTPVAPLNQFPCYNQRPQLTSGVPNNIPQSFPTVIDANDLIILNQIKAARAQAQQLLDSERQHPHHSHFYLLQNQGFESSCMSPPQLGLYTYRTPNSNLSNASQHSRLLLQQLLDNNQGFPENEPNHLQR